MQTPRFLSRPHFALYSRSPRAHPHHAQTCQHLGTLGGDGARGDGSCRRGSRKGERKKERRSGTTSSTSRRTGRAYSPQQPLSRCPTTRRTRTRTRWRTRRSLLPSFMGLPPPAAAAAAVVAWALPSTFMHDEDEAEAQAEKEDEDEEEGEEGVEAGAEEEDEAAGELWWSLLPSILPQRSSTGVRRCVCP